MKRTILLFASVAVAMVLVGLGGSRAEVAQPRPNIIIVITDDQDANSLEYMPYISGDFKASATTFPNATFNFPLCCPSRTSILRGQYTHNHDVWENRTEDDGGYEKFLAEGHDRSTFPVWLDNVGYQTGGFGKYLNGYSPKAHGKPVGFDFFRHHNRTWNNQAVAAGVHLDDQIRENAVRWLKQSIPGGPLMLWVGFLASHHPYSYDPIYAERFTQTTLPNEPSFNELDVSDKPKYVRNAATLTEAEVARLEEENRNRLRGLLTPDEAMRQMVEVVEASGETDNIYFVFWTDNGWMMGQHGLRAKPEPEADGKRHAYLESISIPMLVKGPGVRRGATDERIVMNQDLAPTFADLANARIPAFVDGRSMGPIFDDIGAWREVGLIESAP
jgi:N-acetylglucosamine-6-sulfatase